MIVLIMDKKLFPFNSGRDFFCWGDEGIILCDAAGVVKVITEEEVQKCKVTCKNEKRLDDGTIVLDGIRDFTEMYTGNRIIVTDDDLLALSIQSTPSREDITESSYLVEIFPKDPNTRIHFSSMVIVGEKNRDSFIEGILEGEHINLIDNE